MSTLQKTYENIDYYNVGVECIDIIELLNLNFSCGNAFKYLYRSNNLKSKGFILDDLNKAIYYLNRMRKTPLLNRNLHTNSAIKSIDPTLFSSAVLSAITHVLIAGTANNYEQHKLHIHEAISDIEFQLFNA